MSPTHAITLDEVELKPFKDNHRYQATNPYWLLRIYRIKRVIIRRNPLHLILYYLKNEPIESTAHLMERNPK
ncbi:5492_t:CDS:2 [Funneliformis geosporum]|uniref:5492_t:CDS:1 n=1 Tax=Funneliformis geosporum TaxID=1117311 RepID=A0A9W4T3M5_9GLOM|nr:5492_t:CDS:2 [Funneliformis geosporum]